VRESGSHTYAAMHISAPSGILTQQGNTTMMKKLALTASIVMLVAISGQALARTAAPNAQYWPEATASSDRQVVHAFNAFDDPAMQTFEPDEHRYHGGPKTND
jgi:hypothetical protein